MKNLLFFCLIILTVIACKKDDKLSPCLHEKLEAFKASSRAKTIKKQIVNGEVHYWLNTDDRHLDGTEYILNETCDTVCVLCGDCDPPACLSNYDNDNWKTIWEK